MKVHVLCSFVAHEGGSVLGVFCSIDSAKKYTENMEHKEPHTEWEESSDGLGFVCRNKNFTCLGMSIREYEVQS